MRRMILAAALAGLVALPAEAYLARNGLLVEPEGESFYVPYLGQSGASAFWCAAGDYVMSALSLPPATEIYRYSPPRRPSGEGIRFGFDPARAERSGLLVLFGGPGLSAVSARKLCEGV